MLKNIPINFKWGYLCILCTIQATKEYFPPILLGIICNLILQTKMRFLNLVLLGLMIAFQLHLSTAVPRPKVFFKKYCLLISENYCAVQIFLSFCLFILLVQGSIYASPSQNIRHQSRFVLQIRLRERRSGLIEYHILPLRSIWWKLLMRVDTMKQDKKDGNRGTRYKY